MITGQSIRKADWKQIRWGLVSSPPPPQNKTKNPSRIVSSHFPHAGWKDKSRWHNRRHTGDITIADCITGQWSQLNTPSVVLEQDPYVGFDFETKNHTEEKVNQKTSLARSKEFRLIPSTSQDSPSAVRVKSEEICV